MFQAFRTCSEAVTSAAVFTNSTFPFVTVPNFEVVGAATRTQSGIELLLWLPIVEDNELEEWLKYSADNQGWIGESQTLAKLSKVGLSPANCVYTDIPDIVWDHDENLTVRATVAEPPYIP